MKEKIFKNFSLKILSIICAILLWGIIVNIYDPNTGVTISNVSVQLINTDSLTDKGYTYEVVDGSKISVYVSGPKSIIADIKASDIMATADLSKISVFADYVDIDVKIEKDGKLLQNVEVTPKTTAVKLNIENRVTQSFDVKVEMTGSGSAGYVVFNDTISPTTIKVTGPSSAVQKIAQVKAVYDISDATSDISDTATVVLYDSDGNIINNRQLELSRTEVRFSASIGHSKTVDIIYKTSGTPAAGYVIKTIEPGENTASIYGNSSDIDSISQIVIPGSVLNVDGLKDSKEFKIWLSDYLPSGITVASANYINVKVIIEKQNDGSENSISKQLIISAADIKINNIPDGKNVYIEMNTPLSVNIVGKSNIVNSLSAVGLGANVSLSGLQSGTFQVDVMFNNSSDYTVTGSYKATVVITDKETASQTVPEQTTQSDRTDATQTSKYTNDNTSEVNN